MPELTAAQRTLRAQIAVHARWSREDSAPTGWDALLALLEDWGTTLRLMLPLCLLIAAVVVIVAAVVVIVALIVTHLGPIGAGALLTAGGIQRLLTRRRCRCDGKS